MYQYKNLETVPFSQIAPCLNLAFSDYYLPIHLEEEEIPRFFAASGVDRKCSFGAFCCEEMVGFIFNSCGMYQGRSSVFDAGTGVVPAHRGKGVFTGLFHFTEQELRRQQIACYYLEVLQQNERAIQLYQKQGFSVVREFSVLRAEQAEPQPAGPVEYASYSAFDFGRTAGCHRADPSYEHSDPILNRNRELYEVAYAAEEEITAFCVFAKDGGRLLQLGWKSLADLRQVLQALLGRYHTITAKNIDRREGELLELLETLGFQEIARQFEMVKELA